MSHATATKTAAKKPAKKKVSAFSTRKVDPAYYWMVVPAAIIFAFFLYLPFLDGVKYSFTNSQGYGDYKFIGLKNYIALFQDNRVGHAYLFTFLIAILITVLINVIALFLSVLLNSKIAFKNGFRAIFFIPYTLSVLVIGYVFKYIFMNPLPELGKALGIKWLSTSLLTNEQLSWIPIVFLAVWQGILLGAHLPRRPADHRRRNLRGRRHRRRQRLAEVLEDHIPADWTVLHHQPRAVHEERAQHLRSGRRLDRGRPELLHRNRHLPHLEGWPDRWRVLLPDRKRRALLHRAGDHRLRAAAHLPQPGTDLI